MSSNSYFICFPPARRAEPVTLTGGCSLHMFYSLSVLCSSPSTCNTFQLGLDQRGFIRPDTFSLPWMMELCFIPALPAWSTACRSAPWKKAGSQKLRSEVGRKGLRRLHSPDPCEPRDVELF